MQEEFLLTLNQNLKRKVGRFQFRIENYELVQKEFQAIETLFYVQFINKKQAVYYLKLNSIK